MPKHFLFAWGLLWLLIWSQTAYAFPQLLTEWEDQHQTSTLPDRMQDLTGDRCNLCHDPTALDAPGNCYREDLAALLQVVPYPPSAIEQLDAVDSDGDGFTNGEEATTRHADLPGEIGYNMGSSSFWIA